MTNLINASVIALVLAISALCFAGLMSVEQATAQNVQAIYLDIHSGGQ